MTISCLEVQHQLFPIYKGFIMTPSCLEDNQYDCWSRSEVHVSTVNQGADRQGRTLPVQDP